MPKQVARVAGLMGFAGALMVLGGCATAHVTAFRDPAYANKRFGRLAVFALGMRLDVRAKVERDVCTKLAPTPCVVGLEVMPPTRPYTADELDALLKHAEVDGVLVVNLTSDQANVAYQGTVTTATASGSSSTTGTATSFGGFRSLSSSTSTSVRGEAVSEPIYRHTRDANGSIGLTIGRLMRWCGAERSTSRATMSWLCGTTNSFAQRRARLQPRFARRGW